MVLNQTKLKDLRDPQNSRVGEFMPVMRELPADLDSPVSIYLKLANDPILMGPSFLLESVTGCEQVARYSFIGVQPRKAYVLRDQQFTIHAFGSDTVATFSPVVGQDPLMVLKQELEVYRHDPVPGNPRFTGGMVGYLGYEAVQFFEPSVPINIDHSDLPQAIFLLADTIVAFDHAYSKVILITNTDSNDPENMETAKARLDVIEACLARPVPDGVRLQSYEPAQKLVSNFHQAGFESAVRAAKAHIEAGDIFQVVLSQRFFNQTMAAPFEVYRALRRLNPSPYMFFFNFGLLAGGEPLCLVGASPEMHVRLQADTATLRPIAGTRSRGDSAHDDQILAGELLADPKERAEHVMMVDLARNDLGRVCEYGSVVVRDLMVVEYYSHVMHIVSQVQGRLRAGYDAFDLLRATFPAGTVSGAPKIRAMQIIHDLEPEARGPYAGAVGYFGFDGAMDTCITIRTLIMQGQTVRFQAGAGIVADSDPAHEYHETENKAAALAEAIQIAEEQGRRSAAISKRKNGRHSDRSYR
jgi:anthranilate synthase component I